MLTATMQTFRTVVSEGSDTGMLVSADALDETGNPDDAKCAELLRMYVESQTMVRMSLVPPLAFGKRFAELNAHFALPSERDIGDNWHGIYRKPLGPFYTACTVEQRFLGQNLNVLSDEPIRELHITGCRPSDPDLAVILRNYRMESMFHLTLNMQWRSSRPGDVDNLAKAVKDLKGTMLQTLTITGIGDPRKLIQTHFMMARNIAKGCQLMVPVSRYGSPSVVYTKK